MQPDFQTWIENNARRWASLIRTGLPEFTLISDNELCYWVPTKTLFIPEKMVAQYDRQAEHVTDLLFWIAHEYSHYVVDIKTLPVYGYAEEDYCNRLGAYLSGVAPADGYRALYDLLPEVWAADVGMSLEEAIANIPDELAPGKVFPFPIPPKADDESYGLLETEPKGDYERVYRKFPRGHWGFRSNNIEPEVLSQYPIGNVPDNTEKETSVPESPMPILKGTEAPPKVYPRVMSMEVFRKEWEPQGWKLIFIGPTATWRQEWGTWEAIRDIVQNALDETETYFFGKDAEGLWIADQGKGVAVADFLLGPPKLKPNYARGKFGEGMKIASLALVRAGYPIHVQTVGKELFMIFIEQEADETRVQSLAALWRQAGTRTGTRFHIIGYFGDDYADRFTINLPPGVVVSQAPTNITTPVRRYNQIIKRKFKGEETSRVFSRDIYMRNIDSPFSYDLWGFELSPDRFGPKNDSDMFVDIGRTWAWCDNVELLETFLKMVKDPPDIPSAESNSIDMSWSMGAVDLDDGTRPSYLDKIGQNAAAWQAAWNTVMGDAVVLRTNPSLDATVRHLGYNSVSLSWGAREAVGRAIKTDDTVCSVNRRKS